MTQSWSHLRTIYQINLAHKSDTNRVYGCHLHTINIPVDCLRCTNIVLVTGNSVQNKPFIFFSGSLQSEVYVTLKWPKPCCQPLAAFDLSLFSFSLSSETSTGPSTMLCQQQNYHPLYLFIFPDLGEVPWTPSISTKVTAKIRVHGADSEASTRISDCFETTDVVPWIWLQWDLALPLPAVIITALQICKKGGKRKKMFLNPQWGAT